MDPSPADATIDLHTHTDESDGTYTPAELVKAALQVGLDGLGITDHDTFAGYDRAAGLAAERGLDLVCGIELSTRLIRRSGHGSKTVHLLGYFLTQPPSPAFREWLHELQAGRRDRNVRLVEKLRGLGVDISLAEVEGLGRSLAGRPHFAKILVRKGYAKTSEQAFRQYIGEEAPGFVERDSPDLGTAIQKLSDSKAISVLAHPVRLGIRNHEEEDAVIGEMRNAGLRGIEVYHSDHSAADAARYRGIADKYGLAISGGSDFHGAVKPQIHLGSGIHGNVRVPKEVLEGLRKVVV